MATESTAHAPRKIDGGRWAVQCTWGCGRDITTRRKPARMLGCGQGECLELHNAAARADAEEANRRRAESRRRNATARAAAGPGPHSEFEAAMLLARAAGRPRV